MEVRKRARQRGQAKRHAYWAGIAGLLANGGSREVLCFADETANDTRALRRWRGWGWAPWAQGRTAQSTPVHQSPALRSPPPGPSVRRVPKETLSIVFVTSPVGLSKRSLATKIRGARGAYRMWAPEGASWLGVLKSREPGLSLALLPSRLALFEREGPVSKRY